jgi:hypothetical protein
MPNDEPLPLHAVESAHELLQEAELPSDQRSWTCDVPVAYQGQRERQVELISDDGFAWRFEGKIDVQNSEIEGVRALAADANTRRQLGNLLVRAYSWLQSATVTAGTPTGTGAIIDVRLVLVCPWRAHSAGGMVTLSRRGFAMMLPGNEVERLCAITVPGTLYTELWNRGRQNFRAEWDDDRRSARAKCDNIVAVLGQPIPE